MHNFFFSFLLSIFWSSIVALLLLIGRLRKRWLRWFGVTSVIFMYLLCIIRMVLPVDIRISQWVTLPRLLNPIHYQLVLTTYAIGPFELSIFNCICILWLAGAVCSLFQYIRQFKRIRKLILFSAKADNGQYQKIYALAQAHLHKPVKAVIVQSQLIKMPMAAGIIHKYILLPQRAYADDELYHILLHELFHFSHHDLMIKMVAQLCCCVFWWYPLSYYLRNNLNHLLEIRCDNHVTKDMNEPQKAAYLRTILASLQYADSRSMKNNCPLATLSGDSARKNITERFQLVSDTAQLNTYLSKFLRTLLIGISALFFVGSYLFLPGTSYETPSAEIETDGAIEVTPENGYILHSNNDTYYFIGPDTYIKIKKTSISSLKDDGFIIKEEYL